MIELQQPVPPFTNHPSLKHTYMEMLTPKCSGNKNGGIIPASMRTVASTSLYPIAGNFRGRNLSQIARLC